MLYREKEVSQNIDGWLLLVVSSWYRRRPLTATALPAAVTAWASAWRASVRDARTVCRQWGLAFAPCLPFCCCAHEVPRGVGACADEGGGSRVWLDTRVELRARRRERAWCVVYLHRAQGGGCLCPAQVVELWSP